MTVPFHSETPTFVNIRRWLVNKGITDCLINYCIDMTADIAQMTYSRHAASSPPSTSTSRHSGRDSQTTSRRRRQRSDRSRQPLSDDQSSQQSLSQAVDPGLAVVAGVTPLSAYVADRVRQSSLPSADRASTADGVPSSSASLVPVTSSRRQRLRRIRQRSVDQQVSAAPQRPSTVNDVDTSTVAVMYHDERTSTTNHVDGTRRRRDVAAIIPMNNDVNRQAPSQHHTTQPDLQPGRRLSAVQPHSVYAMTPCATRPHSRTSKEKELCSQTMVLAAGTHPPSLDGGGTDAERRLTGPRLARPRRSRRRRQISVSSPDSVEEDQRLAISSDEDDTSVQRRTAMPSVLSYDVPPQSTPPLALRNRQLPMSNRHSRRSVVSDEVRHRLVAVDTEQPPVPEAQPSTDLTPRYRLEPAMDSQLEGSTENVAGRDKPSAAVYRREDVSGASQPRREEAGRETEQNQRHPLVVAFDDFKVIPFLSFFLYLNFISC